MNEEKLQPELRLALSVPEAELPLNISLNAGYNPQQKLWKLIMLYRDDLRELLQIPEIRLIPLHSNFAIVYIPAEQIQALLSYPQVLYLEQAKPIYTNGMTGIETSCLPVSTGEELPLTGAGTAVAVIDSGVDYRHPDFRNSDGTTRILTYWDQTLPYDGVNRYQLGQIFSEEELNLLLTSETAEDSKDVLRNGPTQDTTGHGTHIAGICAGNGRASGGRNQGVAPEAGILAVKLQNDSDRLSSDYANLMMAVNYCCEFAADRHIPLSINISYGSNDGSHQGDSLLELYLDRCHYIGKITVVCAVGNEGLTNRHMQTLLQPGVSQDIRFSVGEKEPDLLLQLWSAYAAPFMLELLLPGNQQVLSHRAGDTGIYKAQAGTDLVRVLTGAPTPFRTLQGTFLVLQSQKEKDFLTPGIWILRLRSLTETPVTVYGWLPVREATAKDTGFTKASTEQTFTVPSTARAILSVGGYDSTVDTFASFSGQGYAGPLCSKPDLCAPAVNILSTAPGGGYSVKTGTSMAAPFVTGACALLMEYGIVLGRDPYLYGEKIKAYLQKGARKPNGYDKYPDSRLGWGFLCVRDSLPE